MNLLNFTRRFPNEQSCKDDFKKKREQEGVICKKCGCKEHYWLKSREVFKCKQCDFRTTLRSGTVMEASKLPFWYWYASMHLLTCTKKTFSAKEVQRQLGHKRYEPIWALMHKLRLVMGKRDRLYKLDVESELDEGFMSNRDEGKPRKTPILVSATSEPTNNKKKHKPNYKTRFIKITVLENRKKETLFHEAKKMLDIKTKIRTDGLPAYKYLNEIFPNHERHVIQDKKQVTKLFPWVHTAISNLRKLIIGVHHTTKSSYLQNYINEYCYKFNRKYFGDKIFDRLLIASVNYTWYA
jgi:hypothetical protein